MGDAVEKVQQLAASAAALEAAEEPAAPEITSAPVEIHHEAPDLGSVAAAAEHASDNEVEIARIQAEAETERARIAAAVTAGAEERDAALEARLSVLEGRLAELEGRSHEHHRAPRREREESGIEEVEDEAEAAAEPPAPPEAPEQPGAPRIEEQRRRRGLYFGNRRA